MTLVGFPDFQEQAQWQSPLAVGKVVTVANGTTYSFPDSGPVYFNVSNWQATQLRLNSVGVLDCECVWYDAIPATAYLSRLPFSIPSAGAGVISLPNGGPYLQVTMTNNTGGSSDVTSVIAFTNRRQPPFLLDSSAPIISIENQNVNAGANISFDSQFLYAGLANVFIWTNATTWAIDFRGRISNGTLQYITQYNDKGQPAGADVHDLIVLPPRPLRVTLNNTGAGAAAFFCAVTPDSYR